MDDELEEDLMFIAGTKTTNQLTKAQILEAILQANHREELERPTTVDRP